MHQLLKLTKAPEKEVAELKRLYDAAAQFGCCPRAEPRQPAPPPKLDLSTNGPAKALKPWIEVALPHPDVIANRFKEAEFAADLFAVDAGHASEGYATPTSFFGITFLTEGLKRVLTSAAQRLADSGGDPVIGLQTAFGGGKTHTMLAIFHLAKHLADGGDPRALPGLGRFWRRPASPHSRSRRWPCSSARRRDPTCQLKLDKGPRVHTAVGLSRLASCGRCRDLPSSPKPRRRAPAPARELMVEVFKLAGPSVILLDELTMYRPPARR